MTKISISSKKLIFAVMLFASFFSAAGFSGKVLGIQIKELNRLGQALMKHDHNSAIYILPLEGLDESLMEEFTVKEPIVRRVHKRTLPGKTLIKIARHIIYHRTKKDIELHIEEIVDRLREGQPYTYVILGDHMIFTESTRDPIHEKAKTFLSKHYMISGLHGRVRYSGEFLVYRNPNTHDVYLIFDNASGTYQPDGKLLPEVQSVLNENFGDENIHVKVKRFDQKVDVEALMLEQDYLYDDPDLP